MKIACQSCQAKYTIADEKVLGRVVKIRCKKCSSTIVINGNEAADSALSPPEDPTAVGSANAAGGAFDYSAPQGDEWTVNVAEGDQRTMRLQEIVAEYKAGVVNDETYCWKDGMNDWLPLREIAALASACGGAAPPAAPARFTSQAPTAVVNTNANAAFASAGPASRPPAALGSNGNGSAGVFGSASASAGANAAARRSGGRAPAADLFGNAADAGGENDVMTSAPHGAPEAAADDGEAKLTGQRNENSVLFSLSALTSNGPKDNGATATGAPQGDGSGLIDIRALAGSMSSTSKDKPSHVDDIMNLGGGGAFTAALAAPVLAAPPTEAEMGGGASGQKTNKTLMIALGGVTVALLAVVVVLLLRKPEPTATGDTGSPTTASSTGAVAAGGAAPTAPTAVATAETAAAPATAAPPDTAKPPPVAVASRPTTHASSASNANNTVAQAAPPPPAPAPASNPGSFEDAIKAEANKSKPPPSSAAANENSGGGSMPFDRGAAAAAIGAVTPQACKKGDGPSGQGHVSITFAPNGSVSSAVADQPPYQGTAVGGCIAAKYRAVRVPAFSGGSQKVGKTFVIN